MQTHNTNAVEVEHKVLIDTPGYKSPYNFRDRKSYIQEMI